jgi:exopolysaccharide production protein ExoY
MRVETPIPWLFDDAGPPARRGASDPVALVTRRARQLAANVAEPITWEGQPVGGVAKRVVDVVLAAIALVLLSPVLIAVAVLIRLTMGGPVLFSQQRVGYRGRRFRCYKFRSMRADAEEALERHLTENPAARHEWVETQKLKRDPRITPFGCLLRKSSLDELPQLWNVLRGEMSCVGPRPILESELARYGDFAADYMKTRPGITGLWQVSGRSHLSYGERVAIDRTYASHWSMRLDFWIVPQTIPALLRFDGTS